MDASVEVTNPGPRVTGHSLAAWTAEARELLRLAVPMAATQLAQMIILATDTVMLGHFSKEALAAGAIGNTVFFFIWLMGTGPVSAVSPMIAHVVGKHSASAKPRDRREVRAVARMGLWSVALISPPLLAVLFFTRPILLLLHQEPQLAVAQGVGGHARVGYSVTDGAVHRPLGIAVPELPAKQGWRGRTAAAVRGVTTGALLAKDRSPRGDVRRSIAGYVNDRVRVMCYDQAGDLRLPRSRHEQSGQLTQLQVGNPSQQVQVNDLQPPANPGNDNGNHRARQQHQDRNEHPMAHGRGDRANLGCPGTGESL